MDSTNLDEAAALRKYYDTKGDAGKLVDGLVSILTGAINKDDGTVKKIAMGTLLSTDIGTKAVEQLLAERDPKKIIDTTSPEYTKAARFCRNLRLAVNHVKPDYVVDEVIKHRNQAAEQGNQVN